MKTVTSRANRSRIGRPIDTSDEAYRRQVAAYRLMTPQERLRLAEAMSVEVRSLAAAGLRARHPEYSDTEHAAALAAILLGPELADARPPRRASR